MKKVELLSPAGGYETMVGAFNAGADAVYLGGSKFGARAYADNFDREQVLDAISYAHFHGKKIYMTVNTLIKQKEFGELYDFMVPFAERRLDGVIVQDLGVMKFIRDEFPEIELHGSTQQTVTGVHGARLLKDMGCVRVVPARELSIEEMAAIRREADIEVEAFIHGAMCYCYSGACLFSSMVGGRSGNRGRCAQPCRLPYTYQGSKGESYPLSLKDMSTIGIIPELIKAGIDSFKIEGRMKKPEYSAGVTALYRKYIDRYYADPSADFKVSKEDMEILKSLYQRTGISEGYYHRHNGRDMVTISSPAYNATSDAVLKDVHDRYLTSTLKKKCTMKCVLKVGEPAQLSMSLLQEDVSVTVSGSEVQAASKKPMDEAGVIKQLGKLGNTLFEADAIDVVIDDNAAGTGIFMPVSELNELRRSVCEAMEQKVTGTFSFAGRRAVSEVSHANSNSVRPRDHEEKNKLHVSVMTIDQLEAVKTLSDSVSRIYVDSNLFLQCEESSFANIGAELIVSLPYITRTEKWDGCKEIERIVSQLKERGFAGVLARNLEQLGLLREMNFSGRVIADYGVYVWNDKAAEFLLGCDKTDQGFFIDEITVPYELTFREAQDMVKAVRKISDIPVSFNIYGYVPMMISAGCVRKTTSGCSGHMNELYSEQISVTDRLSNVLPVTCNCRSCYNVIWNAHPTSLHKRLGEVRDVRMFDNLRVDFTVENKEKTKKILKYYEELQSGNKGADVFENGSYTTGHYAREVE